MHLSSLSPLLLLLTSILASPSPNPQKPCNKVVKPGESIQAALNAASPGSTITVEAGTYNEQLTITTSGITLLGHNAILSPPTHPIKNLCSGLNKDFVGNDTEAGICIHGSDIQLAPFIKEHRKVLSKKDYVHNVTVKGFTIANFTGANIAVVAASNIHITHNTLLNGAQYGFLSVSSLHTLVSHNSISATSIGGGFIAVCMDDESASKNVFNSVQAYYIGMCTQTNEMLVKHNEIRKSCIGVFVDPRVEGAQVLGNRIVDKGDEPLCPIAPGENSAGAGVIVWGAVRTRVLGNWVENIRNNGTGVGILVSDDPVSGALATGNIVKKNKVKNVDFDIFTDAKTMDTLFEENECEGSGAGGFCK